jgi:hypothetical protein
VSSGVGLGVMSALDDTYETDVIKGIITRKQADVLIELKALSDNLEQACQILSSVSSDEMLTREKFEFNPLTSVLTCNITY